MDKSSEDKDIVYLRGNWQEFVEGFWEGAGLSEKLKEADEHGKRLNDPEYVKSLERAYTWYGKPYVKSNID